MRLLLHWSIVAGDAKFLTFEKLLISFSSFTSQYVSGDVVNISHMYVFMLDDVYSCHIKNSLPPIDWFV